jgi:hypothetical protein
MSLKLVINLRNLYIHLFKKKILIIEKDGKYVSNKLIIYPLRFFYYFLINDLLRYNNINIIYELDNLIFYDNNTINQLKINQIMLNFNIVDPKNTNNKKNFTEIINKYLKHVPVHIIVKIEKINIDFNVQIELLNIGEITIREFQIKNILNKQLYELMQ